ncbi:MAG: hypothetical protein J6Y19_03095 [Kiritimatiellae bacterium]|nr:hypothetical protein [Kiritimatiellia bacterium]
MMKIGKTVLGTAALACWLVSSASAQQRNPWDDTLRWNTSSAPAARESSFEPPVMSSGAPGEGWLTDRLTIGLALRMAHFTENHRTPDRDGGKTFVGYVNEIDLKNETLVVPVVTYWAARYLRLSATWECLKGRTYNYDPDNPYGPHLHSDGREKLYGPTFMVEGLWPVLDDTLFPHVGAGLFFGMGEFREDDFWHYGYGSQESYEADGKPKKTKGNFKREIHSDDAIGWLLSAGVAWRPFKHFQVDLDVRQMWVEPDIEYGYMKKKGWELHRKGEFTFDNVTWTLSAAYVF